MASPKRRRINFFMLRIFFIFFFFISYSLREHEVREYFNSRARPETDHMVVARLTAAGKLGFCNIY